MKKVFFAFILIGIALSSNAQIEVNNFTNYTQNVIVQYEDLTNQCVVLTWQGTISAQSSSNLPVASNTRALTATAAPVIAGCNILWSRSNRPAYESVGPCPDKRTKRTGKATCNGVNIPSWSVLISGSIPVGPGSSIEIN